VSDGERGMRSLSAKMGLAEAAFDMDSRWVRGESSQ
jgi:hypothetical protein